jgi:hypothetical protein
MRCVVCGAELHPVELMADSSVPVESSETQTLRCPGCATAATTASAGSSPDSSSIPIAPSISLTVRASGDIDECESLLLGTTHEVKGAAQRSQQPLPHIAPQEPEASSESGDSVPVHPAPASVTSIISDLDSYLDEIETLLRRAKQMVRDPAPRPRSAADIAEDQ